MLAEAAPVQHIDKTVVSVYPAFLAMLTVDLLC